MKKAECLASIPKWSIEKYFTQNAWEAYQAALTGREEIRRKVLNWSRPSKNPNPKTEHKNKAVKRYKARLKRRPQVVVPENFDLSNLKTLWEITNFLGKTSKLNPLSFREFEIKIKNSKAPHIRSKGSSPALYHVKTLTALFPEHWNDSRNLSLKNLLFSLSMEMNLSKMLTGLGGMDKNLAKYKQ